MIAVAAAAVFLGATLQSATGFGFALVAAPILFAILGPHEAVTAGVLLGLLLNLLTLMSERRRPQILTAEAAALVAWSLPGLAVGAVALRELPERALSVLVAIAVLVALALRVRSGRRARPASPPGRWRVAAAGAASGAMSTSTSLSGPPLVFYLLARDVAAEQMRDTLAAIFVALALLSAPALVVTDTLDVPDGIWVLVAAGVGGQVLGRGAFARIGDRYETAVLVVLGVTALVALGASVL